MSAKLTETIKNANTMDQVDNDEESDFLFLDEQNEQAVSQETEEFELLDKASVTVRSNNIKTRLIQDMVTRWNSTLAMLSRLVLFSSSIR